MTSAKSTQSTRKGNASSGKKKPVRKRLPRSRYSETEIREIFSRLKQLRPEPRGELEHVNPFTLVVAVALSAQATDVGVNRATKALFKLADTPQKMLALGEDKVREHIKSIGLYRNKAKNVIALSKKLIEDFNGEVPQTMEELVTLPGVGRKTANVVLSMAFGQATMAVDTHILRLGNRMGLAPAKTPDDVETILMRIIPEEYLYHAHHWLILHGRYTCVARSPKCEACIIADLCKSKEKTCDVPAPIIPILQ